MIYTIQGWRSSRKGNIPGTKTDGSHRWSAQRRDLVQQTPSLGASQTRLPDDVSGYRVTGESRLVHH